MTLWLIAVGLVTLLGQVVLLREILVASFGSELIYLLAMGLQMLGTALGAVAGRRATRESEARVRALFLTFAVTLPILVGLVRALRVIFRGTPGAYLPFLQQLSGIALVLLPLGMSGGLLFTSAARLYVDRSRTLAAAYAVESIGGLIGGAISTVLIALGVQNLAAALLCSIIAATAALLPSRAARPSWLSPVASALVLLLAAALSGSKRIDRELTALNHPHLLDSRDTPYGRATVTGSLGQIVVFENDALAFESQGTSAEEFVHLAALQAESPRSVLVLGGAIEGLVPEVQKHKPSRVWDVEIDKRLLDLVLPFLPSELTKPLSMPGNIVTFEDPRRLLERPGRYDLILSGMPEPESGQASRFYTREFFDLCTRRLSTGGVMAFRLRSSENLWTPALARRTASIVRALRSAFSDVIVLPGTVNVVVASNGRLERDPDVLSARLRERRIQARLVSPPYLRYVYTNDRVAEIESILARTSAPESRDARPVCYQYTLVLWLSRFFPTLARADFRQLAPGGLRGAGSAWIALAILLIVALVVCRRSLVLRRTLLVGFAGFAGMVLEGSLILAYQISEGVLYQNLGILLTMFMAGLAMGSWAIDRRADPTPGVGGLPAATGVALLLGTAALACLTAWIVSSPGGNGLRSSGLLLLAAGLLTGAIFAFASLRRVESQAVVVAPLYAADLLGGFAGSIAGSLFLIPVLGLPASMLLVGLLAVLALLLV
jgi:spermidine synthase